MAFTQQAIQEYENWQIQMVNSYIQGTYKRGKNTRRDEENVRATMEMLIEHTCHIRHSGIEVGWLWLGMYRKEKKRKEMLRLRLAKNYDE